MIPIETKENRIDWNALRAEYIGGGISQRDLAKKYGVSFNTLKEKANAEAWADLRQETYNKSATDAQQKIVEAASDNAVIAQDIKKRLLLRLKRIEEKYPADATEVRARQDGKTIVYRLRDLTSAFKDLTDGIPMCEGDKNAPIYELIRKLDNDG